MLAFLLALVIDTAPAVVTPVEPPAPPHVYLHPPPDGCDTRASHDEVVVCGDRDADAQYRLHADSDVDRLYAQKPVRAEAKIGAATVALKVDPVKIGDAQDDVHFETRYTDMRLRVAPPF